MELMAIFPRKSYFLAAVISLSLTIIYGTLVRSQSYRTSLYSKSTITSEVDHTSYWKRYAQVQTVMIFILRIWIMMVI